MNRRNFIVGSGATVAGLSTIGYLANLLSSKEKVRMTLEDGDIHISGSTTKTKYRHLIPYAESGGTVFKLVPFKSKDGDVGVLSLVVRANQLYNPGTNIKGDLAERAVDLFNMVYKNSSQLATLARDKITNFYFAKAPAPDISTNPPIEYKVPVLTPYKSIEDIIKQ